MTTVRRARPSDVDTAARVLSAAFESYPWTRWVLGDEDYVQRLEEVQRTYLGHALDHGLVLVDDELRAVAAFLQPDAAPPADEVQERLAQLFGARLEELSSLSLPAAPRGSWTLETVGVRPDCQGEGLGTAVTAAGLALIDERSAPTALETSDPRNVGLYERLSFATVATTTISDDLVVHSMVRMARSSVRQGE